MSLYFAERVEEHIEDREKDKIVFTFPWMLNINGPVNMDEDSSVGESITTSYKMETTSWDIYLKNNNKTILLRNADGEDCNGRCFFSYTLYYDSEMRFEFFSSSRIQLNETINEFGFQTPDGYMSKFVEAVNSKKISKLVLFIEIHIPAKYFYHHRGFEDLERKSKIEINDKIPDDCENNLRFEFMKNSDFTFECLDGTLPAQRVVLFTSSFTMRNHLLACRQNGGKVKYTVAVLKPIITFLHSLCIQLPESYDLEYAKNLLHAVNFFDPIRKTDLIEKLNELLCQKFAKENHNFHSLLQWLSFACEYFTFGLSDMIIALIANEHYFKWQDTFPETARNMENPFFRELFEWNGIPNLFESIDNIFVNSFLTNVILQ
uniref:BTB domain-containing protein n=1 Tax=Panagrolaimus sp. ES5 TaxID=591445 RepID=A0AC34EZC6_9BILA